jgi:hypothetical protein
MQPSQSPKPVAPIRSADTYSPRHSAVTTETKGVISRCQVGPSQAVIVVPDRVDTAKLEGFYLSSRGAVVEEPAPVVEMRESIENQWIRTPNSQAFGNAVGGAPSVAHLPLPYAGSSYSCVVTAGTLSMAVSGSPLS